MIGEVSFRAGAIGLSRARSKPSIGVNSASERAFRIAECEGGASQQSFSSWEIVCRIVE